MDTKSLLYGIIGFLLGGLLVSVAATTFNKPTDDMTGSSEITMSKMTSSLKSKSGDEYDKAFIASMIEHHQGAIDMAKQSAERAKHEEIKKLSNDIVTAQQKEIGEMRRWQAEWSYTNEHSARH